MKAAKGLVIHTNLRSREAASDVIHKTLLGRRHPAKEKKIKVMTFHGVGGSWKSCLCLSRKQGERRLPPLRAHRYLDDQYNTMLDSSLKKAQ